MYRFRTLLAAATSRFANCGDTRTEWLHERVSVSHAFTLLLLQGEKRVFVKKERVTHAIPLILAIRPTLVNSNPDLMVRTDGHVNVTSPPPSGG